MSEKRRKFDSSFKLEVVKMIKYQGLNIAQACRDLKVGDTAFDVGCSNTVPR
ncbi:MAG: transposase [Moraxellaceae bacterium]